MTETPPRVAIVHDWFRTWSGSEAVVAELCRLFPDAPIFALFADPEIVKRHLPGRTVTTTSLQRRALRRKNHRALFPFFPMAAESIDLRGFDVVVSSSHSVAKGVITGPDQLHITYCHSPMRWAWDLQEQYLSNLGLRAKIARLLLHYMRIWDVRTSNGVDHYVANSAYIARRIKKCYGRDATVIHPPVDTGRFTLQESKDDFFVTVSRLVPYKRVDLVVRAFARFPKERLVVIGDGPELHRLKASAPANVTFAGSVSNAEVEDHLRRAKAFLFAAEEDFGIALVEAMLCGTPVIAFGRGGAVETVANGKTGLLFDRQDEDSLADSLSRFLGGAARLDGPALIRRHAEQFGSEAFRSKMEDFVRRAHRKFIGRVG